MNAANLNGKASLTTFLLLLVFFSGWGMAMVSNYLVSIFMGALLAVVAKPVYAWFLGKGVRHYVAAGTVSTCLFLLVVVPILAFIGMAIQQAIELGKWLADNSELSVHKVIYSVTHAWFSNVSPAVLSTIETHANRVLQNLSQGTSAFLLALAINLPDGILQLFLAALACFFFLVDGDFFVAWLYGKIPMQVDIRLRISHAFHDTAISTVWATMAASATQALVMTCAFLALGVPSAFFAGGATFVFSWIPILGSAPVSAIGMLYLYLQGDWIRMGIMGALGVFAGVIDNVMRPLVLKGRGEMHPLVSLVAIFGGIHMFNLFGVFVGPMIAAIVITLLQVWPTVARRVGLKLPGEIATSSAPAPGDGSVSQGVAKPV